MPKTVICFFAIIILPGIIFADEELFRSTLPLDISTSDYYELEAWCERLGIQSSGTRRELEDRLRKHYGLESPVRTLETEEGKSILIESAYSLEYFTLDVIDEKYIRLSGGVVLTLEDSTSSVTHEIRADSIVLNQETNSLTASGNLEYVLTRDGNTEVFRGDSLTFDTESLEGVFFEGISERERKTEDKKIIFYYSGDTIYRSEDNVVTLEDGVITSSKRFPPNYSIRASKIWVLAPGEWAILNAVLNIGRIPVFYIPAFFRPGDPLFFHPALGYRRREGYFVQTTTYLLGKQKEDGDDTTISFLQTLGTEDIERSVNGLFLREQESVTPAQRKFRNYADKTGSYFKVLLDVYSRLGYLVGIDGEIKDLGFLKNLTISAALGRSRQIFETASGYTPLYETEDGTFESMWDSSYLLNLDLPFRYGIDFDFLLNAGSLSLSGKVPAFSDPYFEEDFMDRRERTDWSELIGIETGESTETATTVQQSSVWNLKASWNPAVKTLNPYIDTLSLKTLEASMYWKSRELEVENEENRYFFYPDSIMLPDTTGTLKGVIFSTSFPRSGRAGTEENEEKRVVQGLEIRSPWETGETATEEEEEDDEGPIRAPEMREDGKLEVLQYIIPFQHSLAYAFTPDFSFNTKLNSDNWEVPEDILYDPLYSLLSGQGSLLATYNANLYEDLLSMRVVQNVSVQQKVHYPGEGLSESDKQTYERQDRDSTFIRLNESFLLTSRPLLGMEMMKTSLASYSLKFLAYERSYDENIEDFTDFFTEWTDDYIQEHKLQMDLLFRPETWRNSLGILLQLPPLEREVTLSSQLETGPLITTLRWTIAEDENDLLAAEPFIFREKINFLKNSYLEQEIQYDFDAASISDSFTRLAISFFEGNLSLKQTLAYDVLKPGYTEASTVLEAWPFSFTFSMKDAYVYFFSFEDGWTQSADTDFIPYKAGFSFNWDWDSKPLWKNRIFLNTSVDSVWQMNLQQFTDNLFTFNLDFSLVITDFLDLRLKTSSENTATHLYIPSFMEEAGREPVLIINDFLDSFNFFNSAKRRASHFNLKKISFEAIHKLEDWDLSLSYSGEPELDTSKEIYEYQWKTYFTVMMQWNPIPEIKTEIVQDKSGDIYF